MKMCLLMLLFFQFSGSYSQNNCQFLNYYKSQHLFENNEYKEADKFLDSFLNTNQNCYKNWGYLLKSRILSKLNASPKQISQAYFLAVSYGLNPNKYRKYPELATKIPELPDWNRAQYQKSYLHTINDLDYYLKLENYIYADQLIRMDYDTVDENTIWVLDTIIKKNFINLIKEKGTLPLSSNVGNTGMFNGYLLILHLITDGNTDKEDFEWLNPLLLKEVKRGNYPPHFYANFVDRYYVFNLNKLAPYGTFNFVDIEDEKKYKKTVAQNRLEINWLLK